MKRWRIIILVTLIVLSGGAGVWFYLHRTISTEARLTVDRVENGVIYGTAAFAVGGGYGNETVQNMVPVQITLAPDATFTKTVYHLPSDEELEKNNWQYNTDDLQKEVVSGSLAELSDSSNPISVITVHSGNNIWKKSAFTAVAVEYEVQVSPF